MAKSPIDQKTFFFVDKCMPFGAAISCSNFQRFSDAIAHINKIKIGGFKSPNYLDDFLFVAMLTSKCNELVELFLDICKQINFPLSLEKTEWANSVMVFLGMLLNTVLQTISIPVDKVAKAMDLIVDILSHRKTTVKKIQSLTGLLNFLCRCVVLAGHSPDICMLTIHHLCCHTTMCE